MVDVDEFLRVADIVRMAKSFREEVEGMDVAVKDADQAIEDIMTQIRDMFVQDYADSLKGKDAGVSYISKVANEHIRLTVGKKPHYKHLIMNREQTQELVGRLYEVWGEKPENPFAILETKDFKLEISDPRYRPSEMRKKNDRI